MGLLQVAEVASSEQPVGAPVTVVSSAPVQLPAEEVCLGRPAAGAAVCSARQAAEVVPAFSALLVVEIALPVACSEPLPRAVVG